MSSCVQSVCAGERLVDEVREMPTKSVLPVRIELTTSPLPRGCSTTELRQHD
jgi:hypothetical protein